MKKIFVVTLEGKNYDLYAENGQKIGGFFVGVEVQANSPEEAFDLAYEKLINSHQYQNTFQSGKHSNAVLSVSEYAEISESDPSIPEISGFIFYPEEN